MHTSTIIYTLYLHAITQLIISIANKYMYTSITPTTRITCKSVVSHTIIIIIIMLVSYVRYTLGKMQHFGDPIN